MKIWQRRLFFDLAFYFLFLIFTFFLVYMIVDLSINGVKFLTSGKSTFAAISLYYLQIFSKHLDLFSSLSFLLSLLKVLLKLNANQELTALQMAGLSKKRLLSPFYLFALLLTSLSFINAEWLSPDREGSVEQFKASHAKNKKGAINIYNLLLDNDTELVYQRFDPTKNELFDVYWIVSSNEIWYMKYLQIQTPPLGKFVDHMVRHPLGHLEKKESFDQMPFTEIYWNKEEKFEQSIPPENRPLSTLLSQAALKLSEKQKILSHLHYKLALPFLPFLLIFSLSPFAMRFSRTQPTLLLVALSLFGFIGFITFMDAMLILGENQVLPAFFSVWGPFAVLGLFALYSFSKMR